MDGLRKGKVVGSLVLNPLPSPIPLFFPAEYGEKDDLDADFYVLILHGCAHSFLVSTMEFTMKRDGSFSFPILGQVSKNGYLV